MKPLFTQRLQLQPMTTSDALVVGNMYAKQDTYCSFDSLDTPLAKRAFVNRIIAESTAIWTIRFSNHPLDIIGDCALHHYDPLQKCIEIGGTLEPEYWGKGVMAEAFSEVMQYAIRAYDVAYFIAKTAKQNNNAIRFALKAGFVLQTETEEEVVFTKTIDDLATDGRL